MPISDYCMGAFMQSIDDAGLTNPSGIEPFDLKVLIKPIDIEEKIGAIFIPVSKQTEEKYAATQGTLVAIGGSAFEGWKTDKTPNIGDRVIFAKYAGLTIKGSDGKDYRLCNDEDIVARVS